MKCKYCGTDLPDIAQYCYACGKQQQSKAKRRRRRSQSQGTITKLSGRRDNPYWARLPADYNSGTPVRVSIGCYPTYSAAAEALAKAMYMPDEVVQQKQKSPTLQDMYDRFVSSNYFLQLSKSAQGSHRSAWSHISIHANIAVAKVSKDTFQIIINELHAAGYKRETLAKIRNTASLLCKEAMGIGLMSVNYGQLIQLPKADSEPAKPFSSEQIHLFWVAADNGDKDAMTVLCLIYTGMRPSELLGVDIGMHLHTKGDWWYFQTGSKTAAGKNRIIPIPSILHDAILKLVDNRSLGPLIAAEQGGFWRLDNWRPRRFKPLMQQLGFHDHTVYSCRHTYADLQKRRQISPEIMMEIMGHTDYSTTVERYQTTTDEDIARICAAADGFMRP